MYVCICKGITDKQIKAQVKAGANSLEDLQSSLGIASCCGSCANLACSYLKQQAKTLDSTSTVSMQAALQR